MIFVQKYCDWFPFSSECVFHRDFSVDDVLIHMILSRPNRQINYITSREKVQSFPLKRRGETKNMVIRTKVEKEEQAIRKKKLSSFIIFP